MPRKPPPTPVFLAAIGLSSFTLFALELLAGRLALPAFGGTPSVWTTALCFFTGVVFLGYALAHLIASRLSGRTGSVLHLALAVVAVAAAFVAPTDIAALRVPEWPPALNVLAVFALVAGAPALLVAMTTPLLSAWYASSGRDPWWLYAVSNAASLTGLVAYPFAIEPLVPLSSQLEALVVLIAALAGLLGWIAWAQRHAPSDEEAPTTAARDSSTAASGAERSSRLTTCSAEPLVPPVRRQLLWLFSAMVPAGLLSATSTHLATDYVSSPLLWIGPLGVYLGSFVLAFSERGRRALPTAEKLLAIAVVLMWVPYLMRVDWPVPVLVPLMLGALAVLAFVIHGRLALDRPPSAHLTRFYLVLSAGGMLATAFVALAAPMLFDGVHEYPLLLVAAVVALVLLPPGAAASAVTSAVGEAKVARSTSPAHSLGRRLTPFGAGALAIVAVTTLAFAPPRLARERTFFGITEVRRAAGMPAVEEVHGTTLHGVQFTDDRRAEPTAYFVRSGPLGDIMATTERHHPNGADIGVVGLGVGTIASYTRDADRLTYFEVDQAVVDLARDPRYFSYLADSPAEPRIVLGDGRLSLAGQAPRTYDLIVLDAFSSDSVPTHLLTREAIEVYVRALRPGGTLAFQLTNRHFDLVPAVSSTARSTGLDTRTRAFTPTRAEKDRLAAQSSRWLVVGTPQRMAEFDRLGWKRPDEGPVLTDDYSDVLRLMRRP